MASNDAREQLVELIDSKVFNPILHASPDDYDSQEDRKSLKDLQETTRSTQKSYHEKYTSADKVVEMFRDDLHSDAAQKVHRQSKKLGLPTLNDIKDEFEKRAHNLGVHG